MKSIDLFTGIGGLGMHLPVTPIVYCEKDPFCRRILKKRMRDCLHDAPIHDDVTTLAPPQADIVVAGFPCQDISVTGKKQGLKGKRSVLFYEVVRVAREANAEYIFLENVMHIRYIPLWHEVMRELHRSGYRATWTIIGAAHVGAPHRRLRWFCLAKKCDDLGPFPRLPDKMELDGEIWQGYRTLPRPELAVYKTSVVMECTKDECRGKVIPRMVRERWATPRAYGPVSAARNLTKRCADDIVSQLKFEKGTKRRCRYANVAWVEWLMGFPCGHTTDDLTHLPWSQEPTPRMRPYREKDMVLRMRALGNACVPQQARKAFDMLMARFEGVAASRDAVDPSALGSGLDERDSQKTVGTRGTGRPRAASLPSSALVAGVGSGSAREPTL